MMNNPFSINQEAFDELYQSYDQAIRYVSHSYIKRKEGEVEPQAVSEPQLREFVETAFWASLKHEEGRFHEFSLALVQPEAPNVPFVFEQPVELNPHELAKIAPALNPQDYYVGVWTSETGGLSMWGFAAVGDIGMLGASLTANTVAPGEIIVTFDEYGMQNFSTLITGTRIESIGRSEYLGWLVPESKTKRTLDIDLATLMPAADYRTVAMSMNAHRHGGTLLIVPVDNRWRDSILKPIKFAGGPFFRTRYDVMRREQIREQMRQKAKERGPFLWTEDDRYKMSKEVANKSLRRIGGLTAVDGATVITFELDVLAFGVKIHPKSEDHKPETVLISEPFKGSEKREVKLSDLGGTRHQSGAQFAFDQRDALVFVASQDGRLSVMKWDKEKEKVSVIRPAEYGLL